MVIVISGNSKPRKEDGKTIYKPRKVLKVLPEDARVVVEGVGMMTRHTKPSAKNTTKVGDGKSAKDKIKETRDKINAGKK